MKAHLLAIAAAIGCGSSADTGVPFQIPVIDVLVPPRPGLDLAGPVPLPERGGPAKHAAAPAPVDLVADRAVVKVAVPRPPSGGSVGFSFGDDRRGWVAHIPESVQLPAVAYGGDRVYVSGGFESVSFYGLDATTGRIDWATTNLEDNGPTAAIYEDGRVVFNTESCTLFALDAKTGKRLWLKKLGDPTLAQTAVAGGLVFSSHPADGGQELSAYRVETGDVVWSQKIDAELLAAPIVGGDSVYASTIAGTTYRVARKTGRLVWAKALAATTAPWVAGDELYVTRRHAGKEQQVVVATANGAVVRTHQQSPASSGDVPASAPGTLPDWKTVWAFEGSRPVVDRGVRYVAMGGEVEASDAATGEPLWRRRYAKAPNRRSLGSVALAGSEIVVATRDGQLFGLDVDTGYTLWSYDIGHPVVAEPVVARGWIYSATTDGYVVALEVADATLDGWHMFGGNPSHSGPVAPPPASKTRG